MPTGGSIDASREDNGDSHSTDDEDEDGREEEDGYGEDEDEGEQGEDGNEVEQGQDGDEAEQGEDKDEEVTEATSAAARNEEDQREIAATGVSLPGSAPTRPEDDGAREEVPGLEGMM